MQLFVRPCVIQGSTLTLTDTEAISQLTRVLRAKKGYQCVVQDQWIRYTISCDLITKDRVTSTIIAQTHCEQHNAIPLTVIIGIPNKIQKIELIVQKLTEIGIDHICLVPMARSVIPDLSTHKLHRLQAIILEAVEQSRSWKCPHIHIMTWSQILSDYSPTDTAYCHTTAMSSDHQITHPWHNLIIWPEWWFEIKELEILHQAWYTSVHLPTNILRTETASICAWYQLRLRQQTHHLPS